MTQVLKAIQILNAAKKGWSEEARKKAALTRKRKSKTKEQSFGPSGLDASGKRVYTTGDIESEIKAQRKRRKAEMKVEAKYSLAPSDSAAYQKVLDALYKKTKKKKKPTQNAAKGWSEEARKKAAMTRKRKAVSSPKKKSSIPKKGEYVEFSKGVGAKLPGVAYSNPEEEKKQMEKIIRRIEKRTGKKMKRDPRTGFPGMTFYKDGQETGWG